MNSDVLTRVDLGPQRSHFIQNAASDVYYAAKDYRLALLLGWQDVRQRYRRSTLGPFWLTIGRGVLIAAIAIIFGPIFGLPLEEFLPFLTVGLIMWGFLTTALIDGCSAFIAADSLIQQLALPLFTHVLRVWIRNIAILAHDLLILPIVFLWYGRVPEWEMILAIPGFLLLSLGLLSVSLILGIFCARYRDAPQIVQASLRVLFYLTPVMWMPEALGGGRRTYLLTFNPFYHFIEIVRAPILNTVPTPANWIIASSMTVFASVFAIVLFERTRKRIVFWL